MGEGSVVSAFQFKSYKVDRFNFISKPDLNLLARFDGFSLEEWDVKFRFRCPIFFKKNNCYVGGLDMRVSIPDKEQASDEEGDSEQNSLLSLDAGIAGVFAASDQFEKETEDTLVKIQIPALLLPYLRGTIASFLANAGFGSLIFPLINIHAVAEDALKDVVIKIVDA
jgi:preprotein translocase subunit SecB